MNSIRKSSIYKRFEYELESIIFYAEKGSLQDTFNILSYFCQTVSQNIEPDQKLSIFVANLLIRTQTIKQLETNELQLEIQLAVEEELSKEKPLTTPINRSTEDKPDGAAMIVAKQFDLTEDRVIKLHYKEKPAIALIVNNIKTGQSIRLKQLISILPEVEKLHKHFLDQQGYGKRVRKRLGLQGNGWWKHQKALNKEICEDVTKLRSTGLSLGASIKERSNQPGLNFSMVKKIVQRSNYD